MSARRRVPLGEGMTSISVRIRVDFGPGLAIGPGKIALLEAIHRSGSLARAARELDMSYRRAWLLLQSLNASVNAPVTVASKGGSGGGGAHLTPVGLDLIKRYRDFERRVSQEAVIEFQAFSTTEHPRAPPKGAGVNSPRLSTGSRRSPR